jgi:hypothetical protein
MGRIIASSSLFVLITGLRRGIAPPSPVQRVWCFQEGGHSPWRRRPPLRDLFRDYLPELEMEVARTEAREFRHLLVQRQELCERILDLLEQSGVREA